MANNYLSDRGPSFRKETIKLKPIPAYTFSKTLADEFKAKEITKSEVSDLYESMLVIREFEDMINKCRTGAYEVISDYNYRGPTHLSIGQEATASGVCSMLNITDLITSTHRGHGDSIAKGFHAIKQMTEQELRERCPEFSSLSGEELREAVMEANRRIYETAQEDPALQGMGTTVVLALLYQNHAYIAHVGDSRAYAYENGVIRQVTEDHSLVAEMEKAGSITHAQARIHPHRNIITRAVGTEPEIDVDLYEVPMLPGQVLMLCSDGLTDPIDDDELAQMLGSGAALSEIAETLVYMAENLGGKDNITVVLARVEEEVSAHG